MSTRFRIGAQALRGSLESYAKHFDFLEVSVSSLPSKGSQEGDFRMEPGIKALRQWRKKVPTSFDFCVVGGKYLSQLRPGGALEHELASVQVAVEALQAKCFLLKTPSDITPAPLWRDRLASVFERLSRTIICLAWEPTGVWELEEAISVAKKWGVFVVVDPARDLVPEGRMFYGRLRGLGETRSFGPSALERVVEAIGERQAAYLIIETRGASREAKEIRRIVQNKCSHEFVMGIKAPPDFLFFGKGMEEE
ncbi:DUF72 domain-containing protein [Pajaroellobacter abortibovis]|nr:DUF72 domain-containing protein [Pajaroellobacter abortibovis]